MLAATLGVGAVVSDGGDDAVSVVAASETGPADPGSRPSDDDTAVVALSESSPVTLGELVAETTSTLLATTTVPPTTTTSDAPASTEIPTTTAAPGTGHSHSTSTAPTTAAPTTAPPTTAASTTAAPPTTSAPRSSESSDYSDPDSLQVWLDLAECESDGNWSVNNGNGYYGGLQFSLGTWESVGGTGYPHEHPRDTQIQMGRRLQARDGWGAWPHCSEELGLR